MGHGTWRPGLLLDTLGERDREPSMYHHILATRNHLQFGYNCRGGKLSADTSIIRPYLVADLMLRPVSTQS